VPIPVYDIAIVGGGISGCGVARDAAGRGLTVHLCEKGDLSGAASSASTKLVHGEFRHGRHVPFGKYREALEERDILLAAAPHLARPVRVVMPKGRSSAPGFLSSAKYFAYDSLGGRKYLAKTRRIDLHGNQAGRPLKRGFGSGFEFSDCWVDDARLVLANAVDAKAHGAHIHTRTRCVAARRADSYWRLLLESTETGERQQIAARALVNATGAWVADVLENSIQGDARAFVRQVKTTHIVTRRLYHHDGSYVLRAGDGRVVFVVPFEQDFTLIGAASTEYHGDPGGSVPNEEDIDYLCNVVGRYFREPLERAAIRFVYSGVSPVSDDQPRGRVSSGDYTLDLDGSEGSSPLVSIIGGSAATYRRIAEKTLAGLSPFLRVGEPWTSHVPLPGGGFAVGGSGDLVRALRAAYPFLSELHAERLVNSYGTRAATILTGARRPEDLGHNFGYDLTEAEVAYLMAEEWAVTAGDVLWRRSWLGLRFSDDQRDVLDAWMSDRRGQATVAST